MPKETHARQQFESQLAILVDKFAKHHDEYLRPDYSEAEVRAEFIDPLFETLGWDLQNRAGRSPKTREVFREGGDTHGRVDYVFRVDSRDVFYVEAKAPHVPIDRADVVMQAKRYGWNSRDVFITAVTDFEEFRLYDTTTKPDRKHPDAGLIFNYRYTEYLKPRTLDDLWLLSRESVGQGAIDRLLKKSSVQARQRIPVDQAFLDDLSRWREQLAKAVFKANPDLSPTDLNSIVHIFLDRLIFIRICEDRRIMDPRQLAEVAENWVHSGKRVSITNDLNALFHEVNDRLNGEIFKPGRVEKIDWDSEAALVAEIIKNLYFPASPYLFDKIPVELLGSIYERYLGKTIRVTETRAVVEDKPEVRKAGGVYYTPKYIVDYIVAQTVGKLIEGKTPKQIEKLRILDPACGSGSFLIGAYQKLLDYHTRYNTEKASRREKLRSGRHDKQARLLDESEGGEFKLSLEEKAAILRNNIFGVDIDPQAVEITMMSLYIKMLEGERGILSGRALLPRLRENIKCGNSLIGYDIGDLSDEDKARINPFDWRSKSEGFGEIMEAGGFDVVIGNPPYVRQEGLKKGKDYFENHYSCYQATADLYVYFIEKGQELVKPRGLFGMIISNKWLRAAYGKPLRKYLADQVSLLQVVDMAGLPVFDATVRTIILITSPKPNQTTSFRYLSPVSLKQFRSIRSSRDIELLVQQDSQELATSSLSVSGWSFSNIATQKIVVQLRQVSVPLNEYIQGKTYFGIKTGLNEAFVIDREIRDRLVSQNKASAEIIKPLLVGRNVRRFEFDLSERFLIWTYIGVPIEKYPAILQHLTQFRAQLQKRQDQGEHWWELRACDYYEKFRTPKIIYPDIAIGCRFALDRGGHFITNTVYFIPGDDLYLLGILNSRLGLYYFATVCAGLEGSKTTYLRFFGQYLEEFPVRPIHLADPADKARHDKMVALVEGMLDLHKQKQAAKGDAARERIEREINATDEQIDRLVYELYGLTEEEIKIVEEQ